MQQISDFKFHKSLMKIRFRLCKFGNFVQSMMVFGIEPIGNKVIAKSRMSRGYICIQPLQKFLPQGAADSCQKDMDSQCPKGGIFLRVPRTLGNHTPKHISNMVAFKILPQIIG